MSETPVTAPDEAARTAARERVAVAICAEQHAEMQAALIPVYDTGDPRNEVAACYGCQRLAVAALAVAITDGGAE